MGVPDSLNSPSDVRDMVGKVSNVHMMTVLDGTVMHGRSAPEGKHYGCTYLAEAARTRAETMAARIAMMRISDEGVVRGILGCRDG